MVALADGFSLGEFFLHPLVLAALASLAVIAASTIALYVSLGKKKGESLNPIERHASETPSITA